MTFPIKDETRIGSVYSYDPSLVPQKTAPDADVGAGAAPEGRLLSLN
eukprot:CAMPEP_0172502934 /NCGR_PEP_ID=MMETSP1066-20121228/164304_1 /TAXON_ID=671091 /ORGANISM="Coscinodiscus wailesii, Strain CCMP2513" /LENGTH=46 /DNA_ID= /DNA_START= /DNA_END= /DNA_ORIENTATION=